MGSGKVWRHRCGYQLWAEVLDRLGSDVVVSFRNGPDGVMVWMCPGCGGELQVWWHDSERVGERWPGMNAWWDGEAWVIGDGGV